MTLNDLERRNGRRRALLLSFLLEYRYTQLNSTRINGRR